MIEERLSIIKSIFHDIDFNSKKNDVKVFCPLHSHHKKKLEINIEKNTFHCWVCGFKGSIFKLLKSYASPLQKKKYYSTLDFQISRNFLDEDNNREISISLPEGYRFLLDNLSLDLSQQMLKKLDYLSLKKETIIQNMLGVSIEGDYADRMIFPSRNNRGEINYFVSRSLNDFVSKKYLDCEGVRKSEIIFNEIYIDWSKPIIIVEGVKAYLRHFSSILNIVPILCSDFREHFKLFQEIIMNDVPRVYIALDADAEKKANDAMKKIAAHGIDVRMVDIKDQPDKINTSLFVKSIEQARPFNKDEFLLSKIRGL